MKSNCYLVDRLYNLVSSSAITLVRLLLEVGYFLLSTCAKLPHAPCPLPYSSVLHRGAKFYRVDVSGNQACPWSVHSTRPLGEEGCVHRRTEGLTWRRWDVDWGGPERERPQWQMPGPCSQRRGAGALRSTGAPDMASASVVRGQARISVCFGLSHPYPGGRCDGGATAKRTEGHASLRHSEWLSPS